MFRLLRLLFLGVIAVVLITIAMANRAWVTLSVLPEEIGQHLGLNWSLEVPLFAAIFAGVLLGLLIGFVWEWMREYKIRSTATKATRRAHYLEKEVDRLKTSKEVPKDEILALIEPPAK